MEFFTFVVVGELTALFLSGLFGVKDRNATLAHLLFGVTGAVIGGRIPEIVGQTGRSVIDSGSIGMALLGALVLVGLEMALQSSKIHEQNW